MRYVVGIDAGGTKTVGLLADESGQVLAEARGSGANLQTAGELEVEKVFDDVLESLGSEHPIAAVCLGIAGVDRPQDEQVIKGILRRLGHKQTARVVNDATIALAAGAPERTGVVVLAGTGSIAFGQDASGRTARAGGYGFLLADEGSGYWLGHQALRAVVRAADGRGPATELTSLLFGELEVASVPELVPRVYERGLPKHRIAALAPLVQRAHDRGDGVAAELIGQGARELALNARSVVRQLDFGESSYPVVLAGGVFKGCPALVGPLQAALDLPLARPTLLQVEPARGAVNLALDLLR
jgi:N-acetylglucosamine kinase-like BadF-type ATPase